MAPKKPIYDKPMTQAERQARSREARRARGERLLWITADEYNLIKHQREAAKRQEKMKPEEVEIPDWIHFGLSDRTQKALAKSDLTFKDLVEIYNSDIEDFTQIPNIGRRGNAEIYEWLDEWASKQMIQ